ncbi:MAG: hypothetical protein AABZ47_05995, partial [Planctomycetota bacterium]
DDDGPPDGGGCRSGEGCDSDGDGIPDDSDDYPNDPCNGPCGCGGDPCCGSSDPCCGNNDPCDLECGDPCNLICIDCDDLNPCTDDICVDGECEHPPVCPPSITCCEGVCCDPGEVCCNGQCRVVTVTLAADPSAIPARSAWQPIVSYAGSIITVTWDPAECEPTLEITGAVGDEGYVPPDWGVVEQTEPTRWIYRALLEPQNEHCSKPVNVRIVAKLEEAELESVTVRVLPIHEWWTRNHQSLPGEDPHAPTTSDFGMDYEYLFWKYGTVIATTGGDFGDNITISPDPCVLCPRDIWDLDPPCVYACTHTGFFGGFSLDIGTLTFAGSENQAASIIGHEHYHAGLGASEGECPAYRWEADHAADTGIFPCDSAYLLSVVLYLEANNCPP